MSLIVQSLKIRSGNAVLEVRRYEKPASETIILLHGGPGMPDEMTEIREFLQEKMQVITFDQRGTGLKNIKGCTFTIKDYLDDIDRIADYFQLKSFHLLGHSWGGLYAQIYATERPERIISLFLCSPVAGTGKVWSIAEREVFQYNRKRSTGLEWMMMGVNTMLGFLGSRSAYRRLFKQIIINYHKGYNVPPTDPEKLAKINARAGIKTRQAIKQYPPLNIVGDTIYPVMITYGQYDAYDKSKEYVLLRYPNAKTMIIPDSGHTPWKHSWPVFKHILSDFFLSN
jgi:proline iminopeptidase